MKKKLGTAYMLLAGAFWGSAGIFVRHFNTAGLGTMEIVWFRNLFGLLFVGGYLALFHRELLRFRLKDLWCIAGTGLGSVFLMNVTYYTAMQYASLAVVGVLLYTAPIFVMLLSALFFKEPLTKRKLVALALVFVGCALVSGIGGDSQVSTPGLFWGLSAGFTYAIYPIFSRLCLRRGYNTWTITFWAFVFCFLASCLFCDWNKVCMVWTQPQEMVWAVALGVITNVLPYVFYGLGLETMETGRAAILASVDPVVAALFSVLLFHEPMGVSSAIGMLLVLSAITVLSLPGKNHAVQ